MGPASPLPDGYGSRVPSGPRGGPATPSGRAAWVLWSLSPDSVPSDVQNAGVTRLIRVVPDLAAVEP